MESVEPKQEVTHFDLRRPHVRNTGVRGEITIIQNGFVYSYSIPNPKEPHIGGKIIGKVADIIPPQGQKLCKFCGFIFGDAEGLEKHLYVTHRDTLLMSLISNHRDELSPGELPSEDQLKTEASRMVTGPAAEEALHEQAKKEEVPAVKDFKEKKAKKKGAYREPLRG